MSLVSKSKIIVLHVTKYSDSSIVVHAVDSVGGRRSFLVRGLGKVGKGRSSTGEFHPLCILDAISVESPKSSLAYLREWTPVARFDTIRSDIYKSTISLFVSEVIYRSLRDDAYDTELFEWLCEAILQLESLEVSPANFHLWFLVHYCSRMGFRPSRIIEPEGLFEEWEKNLIDTMLSSDSGKVFGEPLSAKRRVAFSKKMVRYLSYHLGAEINLKSLDILHEIFE